MNRRSFFGWVAKAAAVAVLPVNMARKYTPLKHIWPFQEGTVDLGNGWSRTTKIYSSESVGLPIRGSLILQYKHKNGMNVELSSAAAPVEPSDLVAANKALPPFLKHHQS